MNAHSKRLAVVISSLALLPASAFGQGERFGAVAGTWEACNMAAEPLRQRLSTVDVNRAPKEWQHFLEQRLVVELDKCVQLADAPKAAILDVILRYEALGMDDRALAISLRALDAIGKTADLDLVAGRLLFKRGLEERAIPHLEAVIAQRATDVDANQLLGAHYYRSQRFKEALPYLRVAAQVRSDDFEANAAVGDTCLKVADLDCASDYLERASRLRADDLLLAIRVGDLALAASQFGRAIDAYDRVIRRDNRRVEAWLGIGRSFYSAGLFENAQAALAQSLTLAPENAQAAIEESRALRRLNRAAPTHTERFAASGDAPVEVRVEYALALLAFGDKQQAKRYLESVPQTLAADDRVLAAFGDVWLALSSPREALSRYRLALKARPGASPYRVREARALRLLGNAGEAVQLLAPRVAAGDDVIKKEFVAAAVDRAREVAAAERFDEALTVLAEALRVVPSDVSALSAQAAVSAAAGQFPKAKASIEVVASGDQRRRMEAWIAYKAGDLEAAETLLAKLPHDGASTGTKLLRGATFIGQKQYLEATVALTSAAKSPDQLVANWRAYGFANAIRDAIQTDQLEKAAGLARLDPAEAKVVSPAMDLWLRRVPLLWLASEGKLDPKDDGYSAYAAIASRAEAGGIDDALLSVADLRGGHPERALGRLRRMKGPIAEEIGTRARVESASQLLIAGKVPAAVEALKEIADLSRLADEARLNVLTIRSAKAAAKQMSLAMAPFVRVGLAAAAFNAAMALDAQEKDGAASTAILANVSPASLRAADRERLAEFLHLKQRLY